ncbi:ribosomal RNA small subunit methyltransferase E [Desulfuromonas versatilis]|uniref:Ribosomal RNA small subunit methyltransferase E n=1 Tax=Desulfuromonas versatilis TaxID=2802975 RepID=A0ABN6DS99_9BACT|nr:16S rRNA (uracil(1498)-N(3))-methyltransferase [Desulfuromonas versatilis]BCR03040.1 ribosomal RNA small subunit methyltransferase E [Desulfuromonas versatilis]
MNLILLFDEDFVAEQRVRLTGRRLQHVRAVHRAGVGDLLRVGRVGGRMGEGRVVELSDEQLLLEVRLDQEPPRPLLLCLVLALPRPKMLKRVLQAVTSLGVKQIYLVNSYRVEKSFWGSPLLQPEKLREHLVLGLEQARDTLMPQVHLRPRFKPFVEDELPQLIRDTLPLVAHPVAEQPCPPGVAGPVTLAIGPEGGFIPYEVELLQAGGFTPVSLGERILRVETAVPVLVSRLKPPGSAA